MSDTLSRARAIIVDLLGVNEAQVVAEARFREDLEADSLDLVELIMAFEEEFGGEISDEEAQKLRTASKCSFGNGSLLFLVRWKVALQLSLKASLRAISSTSFDISTPQVWKPRKARAQVSCPRPHPKSSILLSSGRLA